MTKRFSIGSFIIGVVFGLLLTSIWFSGGELPSAVPIPLSSPSATSTGSSTLQQQGSNSNVVSISDQSAGNTVIVESVTIPPPGVWVAVREVNSNGLGNVLGAARVGGPRSNVPVPLLRATEPGRTYAIELYRDDGNGTFNLAADSVYVDFDTGEPVIVYFKTTR